ncbi:MAG TPA: NADH-quinone oxidoreductase subunit NuoG [candidate division Zixibacteria bacterium]|nr:NADH-quinone oxidoreductase subunit NuoG [candidate division Zixibacteria bacterium]
MAEETKKDTAAVPTVTLTIDDRTVTVPKGTTVLEAARGVGIHIPTFCWHPKLKPAGSCRMCYVEIEKWPKLAVSCATDATDGMVVHTNSDLVLRGRRAVLEFLLTNHPLDCPTCDKGGECELQNLTFAHGIDTSRFEFTKYRFVDEGMSTTFDDLKIGPEIVLNRNRCILCYRCVRANKQAFGEYDLGVYERGNMAQINAAPGEQVDNPFSGNLPEICPVGALTNSDWRYKIRVWLTKTSPSICNFTSSGSNTLFYKDQHKNHIYRTTSRRNDDIDDGWIADVTRYGYQIITSPDRLKQPLIRRDGKQVPASWDEAISLIAQRFVEIKERKGAVCIAGLAAPNLDNKALYSFNKFFRKILGSNNIDFRQDYRWLPEEPDSVFSKLCNQPFKIADIDTSDVIVCFATDLIREHPNEYLRVRKARNFHKPRIYSLNPYAVKAADVADLELVYRIGQDEAALAGIGLAAIEQSLADPGKAGQFKESCGYGSLAEAAQAAGLEPDELKVVARALAEGRKITFMIGELAARSKAREIIGAAVSNLNLLMSLSERGQLAVLARYANSRGAEMLGVVPNPPEALKAKLTELWGSYPESAAHNTDAMLNLMKKEEIDACLIVGGNPMSIYPDKEFTREGLEKLDFLVVADMFETETTELADVVLPLGSWAEVEGDFINLEGVKQTASKALNPVEQSKSAEELIRLIAQAMDESALGEEAILTDEIAQALAVYKPSVLPDKMIKVTPESEEVSAEYPHPVLICDDPHHCGYVTEKAPSLVNFAGEAYVELSQEMADRYGLENGTSVRLVSPTGKVILPVKISEHVENDVLLLPRNFSAVAVTSLLLRKLRVDRVNLSKVDE